MIESAKSGFLPLFSRYDPIDFHLMIREEVADSDGSDPFRIGNRHLQSGGAGLFPFPLLRAKKRRIKCRLTRHLIWR